MLESAAIVPDTATDHRGGFGQQARRNSNKTRFFFRCS
jgi:hypothetical protein